LDEDDWSVVGGRWSVVGGRWSVTFCDELTPPSTIPVIVVNNQQDIVLGVVCRRKSLGNTRTSLEKAANCSQREVFLLGAPRVDTKGLGDWNLASGVSDEQAARRFSFEPVELPSEVWTTSLAYPQYRYEACVLGVRIVPEKANLRVCVLESETTVRILPLPQYSIITFDKLQFGS
jgi:hypothetical protein